MMRRQIASTVKSVRQIRLKGKERRKAKHEGEDADRDVL